MMMSNIAGLASQFYTTPFNNSRRGKVTYTMQMPNCCIVSIMSFSSTQGPLCQFCSKEVNLSIKRILVHLFPTVWRLGPITPSH